MITLVEVLEVHGTLDNQMGKTLLPAVQTLTAESEAEVLLLDLSNVKFIDSAGLSTLVKVLKATEASGKRLMVCGVKSQVAMLLKLTRMDSLFEIFDDRPAVAETLNNELSSDRQVTVDKFKVTVL
ncbi:MAG: STAS domain-containing protein [Prochlorotrichaceae cyanobacterium]